MRLSHDYEIIIHVHSNWKMMQIFHTVNYSEIFFTYFSSSIDFHPSFKFNTSLQQCPRRLTQFTVKKLYCPITQRKPQTSSYSGRIILLFCRDKRRFCDFFFRNSTQNKIHAISFWIEKENCLHIYFQTRVRFIDFRSLNWMNEIFSCGHLNRIWKLFWIKIFKWEKQREKKIKVRCCELLSIEI